jgi:hypothetical protein
MANPRTPAAAEPTTTTGFTSQKALAAQISAIVFAIAGVLVAAGLPLSKDLTDHIITLVTVVTPVAIAAFSWLHSNHAKIVAAREAPKEITRVNI